MTERDGSKVSRVLREAILRLELRPGTLLDEAELAERLNVSRTPVREAIIQLIADGLVVREGRKAKVAPLDFDDVPKLYDALLISSRLVHRLAAENRTERDLEIIAQHMHAFETCVENGNGVLRSEANMDFHIAISAATGSTNRCWWGRSASRGPASRTGWTMHRAGKAANCAPIWKPRCANMPKSTRRSPHAMSRRRTKVPENITN